MAKTKKSEKSPKPMRIPKEKSVNVFEDISKVRSNIDKELFEGIKGLFPMLENFSYVMPSDTDLAVEIGTEKAIA
ncbi:hypothetical protein Dimus_010770, partial [Dionaea muscipula]